MIARNKRIKSFYIGYAMQKLLIRLASFRPRTGSLAKQPKCLARLRFGVSVFQLCPLMRIRRPVRQFWPLQPSQLSSARGGLAQALTEPGRAGEQKMLNISCSYRA